jgi:LAS superfamily LD-carboxypeptidase LdcB
MFTSAAKRASTDGREPSSKPTSPAARGAAANPIWQQFATQVAPARVQAKLAVSAPDDAGEREADRAAEQVMRMTDASVQRKCMGCAAESTSPAEDEEETVQREACGAEGPTVAPAGFADQLGAGRPLEPGVRAFFEPRYGADFGGVRVHADERADASARSVNALAFTLGRHVVFRAGRYAPHSEPGRRLLAHELAHVVQQRGAAVGAPRDRGPSVGDATADSLPAGQPPRLAPAGGPLLQRAVRESVRPSTQAGAQVCMIHLHGDEENARQVGFSLFGTHCANLVDLSSTARAIHVDLAGGGTCLADPNRIFTATGIASHAIVGGCPAGSARHTQAQADLVAFRDNQLIPAIAVCRANPGGGLSGGLPVVAFHNNTAISIASYQPGGKEAGAVDHDPARTGGAANPAAAPGRHAHDFMLTTDPRDFQALRGTHNVVLQSATPTDDGSLSVALASDRYVNVEGFNPTFTSASSRFFINNMAMALDVFRQLGVGRKPCATGSAPSGDLLGRIVDFFRRLFSEIGRVLEQTQTLPEPLPREAVPAPPPRGCRVFADAPALDARKADWAAIVSAMPIADVVSWIIGVSRPPRTALTEADRQRACLMSALAASGHLPAGTATAPVSGYRSFADQRAIWDRKFDFVFHGHLHRRNRFDRITDHARTRCGSLLAAGDVQWDTENPSHRACWGAAPLPSTGAGSVPAAPAGGALSDGEKQQEILQASSAPGISRHHLGTDFDFFSVEPVDWGPGGRFFDAYRWLRANAMTYGFIQTFTPLSTFMRLGYMEERWHWSYYPIAQALLEFARAHQGDIEANLTSPARWGGAARFSYILAHWQEFMFNVEQTP